MVRYIAPYRCTRAPLRLRRKGGTRRVKQATHLLIHPFTRSLISVFNAFTFRWDIVAADGVYKRVQPDPPHQ